MLDTGALTDSEMRYGSNQHNNQLIYYIRDIKVVRTSAFMCLR